MGAEAPAVRAMVLTPGSHSNWMPDASSISCAGLPIRPAFSTSRWEFEELVEPITNVRSASAATCPRAACRLVVA